MKSKQTTTSVVPAERLCPRCGVKLGGFGPEGLCGACLIGAGLAEEESVPAAPAPAGQLRRFGDYELLEEIARGGMGVVFRARQVSLDRVVALKMILSGELAGPDEVSRFHREAEAAARLKHPNIVAIHEVGERDGQHFFSMDFIEGRTLRRLTRDNPLSAQRAAECLKAVAEAAHYAHEQGVIHRDLKPGNVLVDAAGQPHVTDFGLAKRIGSDAELTRSGEVMGTPGYMPPEQASRTKTVGPLADVYALGAMLYDLLTGRPPFRGETPVETLAQVTNAEPVAPRLLNAGVPRDLETICLKCLEKDPARRYASARELADDLGRFLNHEPVLAQPPTTIYRAKKFVRRHRLAMAVVAALLCVLLAATGISTRYAWRAERERKDAVNARTQESAQRAVAVAAERESQEQARLARESAAESRAVLGFFLDNVLIAARPIGEPGGLGRDATIRAAVDAAVPTISETFAARPLVEAGIRMTLGDTYRALGDSPAALRQHERAYELCRAHHGEHDEHTLIALNNMAMDHMNLGRVSEGMRLYERLLSLREEHFGQTNEHTIRTMNNLAEAYLTAHRYDQGVSLLEKALGLARQHLPAGKMRNGLLAPILNNLGTGRTSLRRFADAATALEESLTMLAKEDGLASNRELAVRSNLARVWKALGRAEDAQRITEEFATQLIARLGPDHPSTLLANNLLVDSYKERGQLAEAIRLSEQNLAAYQAKLGPYHSDTLVAMNNMALVYRDARRTNEALDLLERTLALRQEHLPADNKDTLYSMTSLAVVYREHGRVRQCIDLLEKARERATNHFVLSHPATLHVLNILATAYDNLGRSGEAIPIHEETLRAREAAFGSTDQQTCESIWNLASAYRNAGREADSLGQLRELLTRQTSRLGASDARIAMAQAYFEAEKFVEAANILRGTLFGGPDSSKRDTLASAQANVAMGERLLHQSKFTEAEPFLKQALESFQEQQPGLSPTFTAQGLLGWALLGQKKFPEATNLLVQSYVGLAKRQAERPSTSRAQLLKETAQRLVQLYEAWEKPANAAEWRSRAQ